MNRINIAIFVSGSGTNCENLIQYFKDSGRVNCALVLSNKADAYALVRAERLGVPTAVAPKAMLNDAGASVKTIQSIIGQEDFKTTADRYCHPRDNRKQEAVEGVDKLLCS